MEEKLLIYYATIQEMRKNCTQIMRNIFLLMIVYLFTQPVTSDSSALDGNYCSFLSKNPFEVENENSSDSVMWRSYPLLNCTAFDLTNVSQYQHNTKVYGLLIQGGDMREFHMDDLLVFSELKSMEFRNNLKLASFLISNTTRFENVVSLSITSSQLNSIPTQLMKSLPRLSQLTILNSKITKVDGEAFSVCSELQTLNLDHNEITHLNISVLLFRPILQRLSLRNTGINDSSVLFKSSRHVQFLDLADNRITILAAKSFRKSRSLTTLILANNNIREIDSKAFKGTINLRYIDLTGNFIKTLYSGTFAYSFTDELTVDLWENPINCDCKLKWLKSWLNEVSGYGSYPDIRLKCYNPIRNHNKMLTSVLNDKSISMSDLSCLSTDKSWKNPCSVANANSSDAPTTTTQTLITSKTAKSSVMFSSESWTTSCATNCSCYTEKKDYLQKHHQTLQAFSFPLVICVDTNTSNVQELTHPNTRSLIVSNSEWKEVNVEKLQLPDGLTSLVLKKNQIRRLISNKTIIFEKISVLSLQDNLITSISKDFLASFPNLRQFRIFNNRITYLPDDLFIYNRLLTKVFLGPNPLQKQFTGACIKNSTNLITLGLRGINLKTIPLSIGNKIYLRTIDLSDNDLTNISSNAFWNCLSLTDISLENNRISSMDAEVFRNNLYLKAVDLSENKLTTLSLKWFSNKEDISRIELWQNPIRCDCNIRSFVEWIKQTEHDNPSTEIRFRCEEPLRMRAKTSDETFVKEYVCENGEHTSLEKSYSKADCLPTWSIVLAVIATAMCFIIIIVAAKISKSCSSNNPDEDRCCQRFYTYSFLSATSQTHRRVDLQLLEQNVDSL